MGWLIALAVLLGLVLFIICLPVGVRVIYDQDDLKAWYTVLSIRVAEVDLEEDDKKLSLKKILKSAQRSSQKERPHPKMQASHNKIKAFWDDLILLLDFYWGLLDVAVLKRLDVKLILTGDDPCDLAVQYGQAWAAVGTLLAGLESLISIGKRNVDVRCDFVGTESCFTARLDFSLSFGRLLAYMFRYIKNNMN